MSFPSSLAAYELAFEVSLKKLLGAEADTFTWPDSRDIEDAYFRATCPHLFATESIEKAKWNLPATSTSETSSAQDDSDIQSDDLTLSLF